ncbi:aspartate/glutamate racemase family protein [Verminephrobacter eiseniae]|uniref:aspartate/glutamate racemase family protein n=1 Tax=Verminephrobacter eiseniae TaxID=364317 RepID=UPI0010D6A4DF|nr:aspartate/glutamate racemase family protein [Verminephrobacter eiseniae]KAB7594515.1 Asp/Glu racemase [Verminephrobacter sp. Larva24]MCW5232191.1 Asp/Glu racemase [Verminephrobacter eiseniae]MCW5296245.1 Asp/Glu racemase [Verminephrobacter eiseniae]MCW8187879.1 Asp/Glu racemase [Verminephrobacter eiseniae]MCW8225513.1 Asp/Glu racemase [Verminephrobacter eiseniae]
MRQLLVINPNTSAHVSALLQQHVQAAAGLHVAVRTVTARFGAPYIACEASYAVAAHAALDAWAHDLAQSRPRPDAVLIGCFGDPGLMALRASSPVPVTGLAEASFVEAARHGRYAIVTGGQRWGPMLQRLAQALGQTDALAGIHTVAATGAQLAADPVAAHALLAPACRDAVRQWGVQAVILGGAGMAGMAAAVQSQLAMLGVSGVPVIDSVLAGAHWALHAHPAPAQRQTPGFDVAWTGLSPEMALLGA